MTNAQTEQMHQQANILLNNNRMIEARTLYDQICVIDNEDAEAYMMRGALDGELGKIDDALQSLQQAIEIDPEFADAYHTLANLLKHRGDLTAACTALQRAVEIDPEYAEAWEMLGGVLGQQGEYIQAESACRKALELEPDLVDARANYANALVEQGKEEAAIPELRRVVQQQPGIGHIWSRLGAILARLDQFDEAVSTLETALRLDPSDNETRTALGHAYFGKKQFTRATELLQQVVENSPDSEPAWAGLVRSTTEDGWQALVDFCQRMEVKFSGNRHPILTHGFALEMLKELDQACHYYEQVTRDFPDWGDGWNRLGLLQMRMEESNKAAPSLKKALDCGVDSPLTLCMYGAAVRAHGSFMEAEHYCKLAMEKAPELIPVYVHLGIVQTMMGKPERALETFNKGRELDPDDLTLIAGVADVLERKGEFEKALAILEPVIDIDSDGITAVACIYAKVSNKLKRGEQALGLVEKMLARENTLRASAMDLHFRAADIYHSQKQYDTAIEHYNKANALSELEFDREAHSRFVDDTISAFDSDMLSSLASIGDPSARPIFIVGMPRSGTSLAEQILASHPDVYGAGELMDFAAVSAGLGFENTSSGSYTVRLVSLNDAQISRYAKAYLHSIDELSNGELYVIDKLPYNFLRLGLLQIVFPNARVIHTRRDPMDTCLSCYFLDFMGSHPHAYDLEDLGIYYREYERLMAHWHDVLSIPILDVQYEEAVEDIEATCRRMISFCGLEWDDRVLDFHRSDRVVRTASYDQVRRPVYRSSVARWKPYEKWLDPLKRGLSGR